jgi:hypothetical protein
VNDGSVPITFTWRGITLRAQYAGGHWIIIRGGRALAGPAAAEVEDWSITLQRLRDWLDEHSEGPAS